MTIESQNQSDEPTTGRKPWFGRTMFLSLLVGPALVLGATAVLFVFDVFNLNLPGI